MLGTILRPQKHNTLGYFLKNSYIYIVVLTDLQHWKFAGLRIRKFNPSGRGGGGQILPPYHKNINY